ATFGLIGKGRSALLGQLRLYQTFLAGAHACFEVRVTARLVAPAKVAHSSADHGALGHWRVDRVPAVKGSGLLRTRVVCSGVFRSCVTTPGHRLSARVDKAWSLRSCVRVYRSLG